IIGIKPDVQAGQLESAAMLLHQPTRSGVVECVDDKSALLQETVCRTVVEFLPNCLDLDPGGAKYALAQHFNFPAPDIHLTIKLGADVVFLHAVAIEDAQLLKALTGEIVG